MLGFFKYFDFFVDEPGGALLGPFGLAARSLDPAASSCRWASPSTPSRRMSYTIDIYRGTARADATSFLDFALFVAFFPQLVAGPIERARDLLPQIAQPRTRRPRADFGDGLLADPARAASRRSSSPTTWRRIVERDLRRARGQSTGLDVPDRRATPSPSRSTATSRATPTSPAASRALHGLRADGELPTALLRDQPAATSGGAGTSACPPGCATTSTSRWAATAADAGAPTAT